MNAKPKATINFRSNEVASTPAMVAAKPAKVKATNLPTKPVVSLNSVRRTGGVAKPRTKTAAKPLPAVTVLPAASQTKQSQLIASLRSSTGVTIDDMMALTGWQAHSVRGTISGALRKKLGLNVVCQTPTNGGQRLYRIQDLA